MEPLAVEIEVEARTFANRFEAAEYLLNRFAPAGLTDIERDSGLWAWLSLFYFDAVCPPGRGGVRKPGAIARHIPEPGNFQRYYRHLLAGPYRIYRAHRENPRRALALLCQPLDSPGDVVEQLASRQEVVTNPGILELATKLYVDSRSQRLKRGAGGKSSGSARRRLLLSGALAGIMSAPAARISTTRPGRVHLRGGASGRSRTHRTRNSRKQTWLSSSTHG
jgi:hypothetical protein